jgi:hypothetical protein
MENILLGLMLFNAFFKSNEFQYDSFEIGEAGLSINKEAELDFEEKLKKTKGLSFGSREYNQATPWFRYGHATYIYGHKYKNEVRDRKLNLYGGYVGLMTEINYKRYFGVGVIIGGGATHTDFNDRNLKDHDRSNYFGLASPYITLGYPITKTGSINLTASTYFLSTPSKRINGTGEGFEPPHNLENKFGLEFVWSWN